MGLRHDLSCLLEEGNLTGLPEMGKMCRMSEEGWGGLNNHTVPEQTRHLTSGKLE